MPQGGKSRYAVTPAHVNSKSKNMPVFVVCKGSTWDLAGMSSASPWSEGRPRPESAFEPDVGMTGFLKHSEVSHSKTYIFPHGRRIASSGGVAASCSHDCSENQSAEVLQMPVLKIICYCGLPPSNRGRFHACGCCWMLFWVQIAEPILIILKGEFHAELIYKRCAYMMV